MTPDDWLVQSGFDVRLEWGPQGLRRLAPVSTTLIVVDVLSFSTAVCVALESGARVHPYRAELPAGAESDFDADLAAYAAERGAIPAARDRSLDRPSLSPTSLASLGAGSAVVLPSANGSALAFAAREHGAGRVLCACLRNASAVARSASADGGVVGVVPAGERWRGRTGPMRVAVEDLLGAGAVVSALPQILRRSPEASAAAAAFEEASGQLYDRLASSPSGRELIAGAFGNDVLVAGAHDAASVVPVLDGEAFVAR